VVAELLIPGKNLNFDRQPVMGKAMFEVPSDWTKEMVVKEARKWAYWYAEDAYKDKGWVHYRESGEPAFWLRGGKYAPLEGGKGLQTNQNKGVSWGSVIPDLSKRRWFIYMRFHAKPVVVTKMVWDGPVEDHEKTLLEEGEGTW